MDEENTDRVTFVLRKQTTHTSHPHRSENVEQGWVGGLKRDGARKKVIIEVFLALTILDGFQEHVGLPSKSLVGILNS